MAKTKEDRIVRKVEERLVRATMQAFSGPLPPPDVLQQYNAIIENGAERIMSMAEKQQEHRHYLEKKIVKSNTLDQRLGLILGFVVIMSVAGAGVWLVTNGRDASGAAALVAAVAAPVAAFIYGRRRQQEEIQNK